MNLAIRGIEGQIGERVGLAGGGPAALITTLGVFRFDVETREAVLASYHPSGRGDLRPTPGPMTA